MLKVVGLTNWDKQVDEVDRYFSVWGLYFIECSYLVSITLSNSLMVTFCEKDLV